MTVTRMTSREFSQAPSKAKRAARNGPVLITDRGRPSFVLLTAEAYDRLLACSPTLAQALGMAGDYVEFEPERSQDLPEVPDLTECDTRGS